VSKNRSTLGHHLIVGLSGPVLSDADKRILEEYRPAGILFLGRNFYQDRPYREWLGAFSALLSEVRRLSERPKMLITLDHEGGAVVRTPSPITRFPPAAALRSQAGVIATATAQELKSLGVNVSWAPVCDVNSNPLNPIIGVRAFSTNPEEAATFAAEYSKALVDEGILTCAKHFPGHGDTTTDSHLELPRLMISAETLRQRELVPFVRLAAAKVPMVMTAHVLFPALDPHNPATFSERIIKGILREELGYDGVVVSDDLDMNAVSFIRHDPSAIIRLFTAGCDMAIVARNAGSDDSMLDRMADVFAKKIEEDVRFRGFSQFAYARVSRLLRGSTSYTPFALDRESFEKHYGLGLSVTMGE
jgi:beta-N-acetylhexosaminidase